MKLSNFIIVLFLVIGIAPALIMGHLITEKVSITLKTSSQETISGMAGLEAVAESKAKSIENTLWDIYYDLELMRSEPEVVESFSIVSHGSYDNPSPEFLRMIEELDEHLEPLQDTNGIFEINLLDPNGRVIYTLAERSHNEKEIGSLLFDSDEYLSATKSSEIFFTDIFENAETKTGFGMLALASVNNKEGDLVGFIVFSIDTKSIYNLIQDTSGLGETGETLLGKNDGDHVLFLTPLRHDSTAALFRTVSYSSGGSEPIKEATRGLTGASITTDYRKEQVIAAWRPLNLPSQNLNWGLVAKIDTAESFGALNRIESLIWSITGAMFIILLLAGLTASIAITKPIKRLSRDVTNITKGDLDIKLNKSQIFEVNELTDSLNRILASLKLAIHRTGATKSEIGLKELTLAKKQAEKKYKVLYETSSDAIMTLAPPTWKFTSGNPATIKMFGVNSEEEFTSKTPDQYSPEYQPDGQLSSVKAKKMIELAMYQGKNFFEWTHKRANGEDFPATVLLSRIELNNQLLLQATVRDISLRKDAERKLKEIKGLYGKILDNINTGVKVADKNGKILYANENASKLIGSKASEVEGEKHADLFSQDTAKKFKPFYAKAKKTLKPVRYSEIEVTTKNGKTILQSGWIIPLTKDNKFDGIICTSEDVTENKKVELENLRYRNTLENYLQVVGNIIIALDSKGRINLLNNAGYELLGYKKGSLEGENWFQTCLPKGVRSKTFKGFKKLMRGKIKAMEHYENPVITKNGEERLVKWFNSLVRDSDGKIIGTISSGVDITDIKKGRDLLKESEEQFRSLAEASPDCIKLFDLEGNLLYINPGGMKEHRLKKKDLKRWKPIPTIIKDHHQTFIKAFKLAKKGKTTTIELKHTPKGSRRTWCLETMAPVRDAKGKIIAVFGVSRDISHLKEANK